MKLSIALTALSVGYAAAWSMKAGEDTISFVVVQSLLENDIDSMESLFGSS
jgi:hypothetical protein